MELRLVQWSISAAGRSVEIADFTVGRVGHGLTVVSLEGVNRSSYETLVRLLKPTSSCFSLDLREPSSNEGDERKLGIGALGFGLSIMSMELMGRALYPERTLSVVLGDASGPIRVATFDSLSGIPYPTAKNSNYASVADYLELQRSKLDFLCFDAYEPKQEGSCLQPHMGKAEGSAFILGPRQVHDLSDSYAEYLGSKGEPVTADPHTVSYVLTSSGQKHAEKHYDYIMHDGRRWHVANCEYPLEESIAAGSDHSAVIADFEEQRTVT